MNRRKTIEVNIGGIKLGAENPVRIQSMTTEDTMDTQASIEQSIRIINAGSDYVRLTAPSLKDAQNLEEIRNGLREKGYQTPLIADIHFTPNAAELAARIVEKVRVNPGNYADKKKFEDIDFSDDSYALELKRIEEKFKPLVEICKENGTAMRIGTNHGSLSDRIMSRYGDTPLGMVESALEFIRICDMMNFHELVLSMKASNPQVMVHAYRMLIDRMEKEGLRPYPLHLGVTEAGEGEDGRIKSAIGIGMLMEDGFGDTIRVSLTEDPEFEIPVARTIASKYAHQSISADPHKWNEDFSPFEYKKRKSQEIDIVGGDHVPIVISDFSGYKNVHWDDLKTVGHHYFKGLDKWKAADDASDFIYLGDKDLDFELPGHLKKILDYGVWSNLGASRRDICYPLLKGSDDHEEKLNTPYFHELDLEEFNGALEKGMDPLAIYVLRYSSNEGYVKAREVFWKMIHNGIENPIVLKPIIETEDEDPWLVEASIAAGGPLIDGYGNGIWVESHGITDMTFINRSQFGILQATRTRISKTEYISCPSCGRTLFDLQDTTAMIRERTDHLSGVKIAIMGCIVNGPGEMADADYGYVGSGRGKITLYRGKEVVKRGIPSEGAVNELIELIREDGLWTEPELITEHES